jgi:hypothetical protein
MLPPHYFKGSAGKIHTFRTWSGKSQNYTFFLMGDTQDTSKKKNLARMRIVQKAFPEVKNSFGDIEVTHPLVKDFLEHKIRDFFFAYPDMHGIILTLHETKVPLLKLIHIEHSLFVTNFTYYCTNLLYE